MSVISCPLSLSLICSICSNPYIGPDHSKHSAPFGGDWKGMISPERRCSTPCGAAGRPLSRCCRTRCGVVVEKMQRNAGLSNSRWMF